LDLIESIVLTNALANRPGRVPKSPSNHFANLLKARMGEETCHSHFAVAGPQCETMGLGVFAQRVNARLIFDRATEQITKHKQSSALLPGMPLRMEWQGAYKLV
jgi:hypothetical protein